MNIKKLFQQHYLITILLALFLFYRIKVMLDFFGLGFDASIYIGQAKFIYSLGATGYFEPLRPLVLPLILGFGWILGFNIVIWGKIIAILISSATIVLTYMIASKLQNKIAGVISSFLLAITPVFFLFSDKILTGIPSIFFALLSLYFFISKKYWLTGFFAAIAFMTRFPQGILLLAYGLIFVIAVLQAKGKRAKKHFVYKFVQFIIPYTLVVASYLIFNIFKYWSADSKIEAMFWPFIHGNFTISTAGLWMYSGTRLFYFIELFKQNYFFVFFLAFLIFYVIQKKYKEQPFNLLIIAPVLLIAYFTYLAHKEVRFALVFIPYLAITAGIALAKIYGHAQNKKKLLILFFAILLMMIYFLQIPKPSVQEFIAPNADDVCLFINENDLRQPIILTTPYALPCLNNKIDMNLFSIPLLLRSVQDNPKDMLIFAPETFVCPEDDLHCNNEKIDAMNEFKSEKEILYFNNNSNYPIYVFGEKNINADNNDKTVIIS